MTISTIVRTAIVFSAILVHPAAKADILSFTGSMSGIGINGPNASCSPLPFRGTVSPATAGGTSSLGSFTYSHDICNSGMSGPLTGTFAIDFGVDSFIGSLTGNNAASATPGIANLDWTYTILSGTGRFLGASGQFSGIGTTDARVPPAQVSLTYTGRINAPAVPEPASWAMMLLGFAGAGLVLRRSRRSSRTTAPAQAI